MTAGATISPAERQAFYAARWRREHLFFTVLPIVMLFVVVVGFAPTYYLKAMFGTPELRWLCHTHGLAFTSWMVLLIIQPALVLARRTPVHRQVGWIAAALVPVMTVLAWLVSIDLGRRGAAPPGVPPLIFLVVPMATVVVFPAFVAAALYWRGSPDTHKRLMLIATIELIPAGLNGCSFRTGFLGSWVLRCLGSGSRVRGSWGSGFYWFAPNAEHPSTGTPDHLNLSTRAPKHP